MAVEGVSSSNNNTTIIAGSTIVGAAGGGIIGYNTKPWLKDDAPSDSFIKKVEDSIKAGLKKDQVKTDKIIALCDKVLNDFDSETDITADYVKKFNRSLHDIWGFDQYKKIQLNMFRETPEILLQLGKAKDYEKIQEIISPRWDAWDNTKLNKFGTDVLGIRMAMDPASASGIAKVLVANSFDPGTKKFVGKGDHIKEFTSIAKSMQGKAALIWGAAGALVLGLGAFAATAMTSKKSTPETPAETQEKPKEA